ncbi:MAG: hypothetical protein ACREO3_11580 [Arenimonas sp.]
MPRRLRPMCWWFVAALALSACRPADAPKEPTEPTEPTVSRDATPHIGGMAVAIARRGRAVTRL